MNASDWNFITQTLRQNCLFKIATRTTETEPCYQEPRSSKSLVAVVNLHSKPSKL
jgi:hypothetical protein